MKIKILQFFSLAHVDRSQTVLADTVGDDRWVGVIDRKACLELIRKQPCK